MTIRHILLIPSEGDPHGLLKDGPCCETPPMASAYGMPDDPQWHPGFRAGVDTGLALAWAGERLLPGLLRAEIAMYKPQEGAGVGQSCPSVAEALKLGRYYERQGLGRLVVVSA